MSGMSGVNVAVVGATGQVGGVMRRLLAEREFPVASIRYVAVWGSRAPAPPASSRSPMKAPHFWQ